MTTYLVLVGRTVLGVVLLVAICQKTVRRRAFREFAEWLAGVTIRPARPVAAALLVAESIVVALLLVDAAASVGLVLGALLLGGYAVGIGWLSRRGVSAPCRCFGAASARPMGSVEIVRNLALAAGSLAAAFAGAGNGLPTALAAQAVVLGCGLAMVTVRLDSVVQLFRA